MVSHAPEPTGSALLRHLYSLAGGPDPEFASDLLEAFLASARESDGQIREAVTDGNTAALGRAAHRLKSSFSTLGLEEGVAACAHLEALARQQENSLDEAVRDVQACIVQDVQQATRLLEELRAGRV